MKGPPTALLDTSALIKLDQIDDPPRLPQQSRISAVTLAELSVGPLVTANPEDFDGIGELEVITL